MSTPIGPPRKIQGTLNESFLVLAPSHAVALLYWNFGFDAALQCARACRTASPSHEIILPFALLIVLQRTSLLA